MLVNGSSQGTRRRHAAGELAIPVPTVNTAPAGKAGASASSLDNGKRAREHPLLLLVDDDPAGREALEELLRTRYAILSAGDGERAIELACEHAPDLIVMDVVMPKLSGVGAFEALLNDPRTADIPVIFLSGHPDEGTTALCLNRGA